MISKLAVSKAIVRNYVPVPLRAVLCSSLHSAVGFLLVSKLRLADFREVNVSNCNHSIPVMLANERRARCSSSEESKSPRIPSRIPGSVRTDLSRRAEQDWDHCLTDPSLARL
jgi:hypothetical protein